MITKDHSHATAIHSIRDDDDGTYQILTRFLAGWWFASKQLARRKSHDDLRPSRL